MALDDGRCSTALRATGASARANCWRCCARRASRTGLLLALAENRLALLRGRPGARRQLQRDRDRAAHRTPGRGRDADPTSARPARAGSGGPRLLRARHRRGSLDQDVPRARASARMRSPRSRACSERGWRAWPPRSRRGVARRSCAGRCRGGGRAAVRDARRGADAGDRADPGAALQRALRDRVRRGMLGRRERETGEPAVEQELAVCFADLVGFTRPRRRARGGEVGGVAGRLARLATDVTHPPVRLVKTIGDAVMFVSPDQAATRRGRAGAGRRGRTPKACRACGRGSRSVRRRRGPATTSAIPSTSPAG